MNIFLASLMSFLLSISLTGCGETPMQPPEQDAAGVVVPDESAPLPAEPTEDSTMMIDWNSREYSYTVEELSAEVDGHTIYGQIYIPSGIDEPLPAVIISHGYGGTHSTNAAYAEELARKGLAAYCFDFRGGGSGSRSDGSPLEMTVFTEKTDLEAVLGMIQGLDYVDSSRIFLMGTSQGGMVSAMTGAAHPDEIKGMMLLYPAFCIPDDARSQYTSADEVPERPTVRSWLSVGHDYVADVLDYDVYADVTTYAKDVLILHGDRDGIVDLSYSQRAAEEYPSAELKVIEGAGHGFGGHSFDESMGCILEYLGANLS